MIKNDPHFTVGMILTVLALYSFSIYTHFSKENVVRQAYAHHPESEEAKQEAGDILEAISTRDDNLFRPIGVESVVYVPGANCTITSNNLSPDGELHEIPQSCFFVDVRER